MMRKLGVIYQERLKTLPIKVTLLLSANKKSYLPRRLAQQRMTLSDLELPFRASLSVVAELLVAFSSFHFFFISVLLMLIKVM